MIPYNKNFGIYFGLGLFLRNFVNSKKWHCQ